MSEIADLESEMTLMKERIKALEADIITSKEREEKIQLQFFTLQKTFLLQRQQLDVFYIQATDDNIKNINNGKQINNLTK